MAKYGSLDSAIFSTDTSRANVAHRTMSSALSKSTDCSIGSSFPKIPHQIPYLIGYRIGTRIKIRIKKKIRRGNWGKQMPRCRSAMRWPKLPCGLVRCFGANPKTSGLTRKKLYPIPDDDLALIERFYTAALPKDQDFRRRDLPTLLNNWTGELDRARKHFDHPGNSPKPKNCL